ncbi:hypothetical protein Ancab_004323 [Ancistrocladus abbreviatus]
MQSEEINRNKKKKRRGWIFGNPIPFVFVVVAISCMLVLVLSILRLPDVSVVQFQKGFKFTKLNENRGFGKLGEMMVELLPCELAFTVFVPSEKAFERDLRLHVNSSLVADQRDDTDAILSRVLGFSAIPRKIYSNSLRVGEEISFDSVSGFRLYIHKLLDGSLVVNGVRSAWVDMSKREIVVHIMDGVIMDAEFEQSVQPDEDEDN